MESYVDYRCISLATTLMNLTHMITFFSTDQNCTAPERTALPLRTCINQKYTERFDNAFPGDDSISFSILEAYDTRLNLSLIQQESALAYNSSGSYPVELEELRFLGPQPDEFSAVIAVLLDAQRIHATPERYGTISLATLMAFRPDGETGQAGWKSFEYDPDLSLAINFLAIPPSGVPESAATQEFNQNATTIAATVGGPKTDLFRIFGSLTLIETQLFF